MMQFLAGILVWQVAIVIFFLLTGEKEEKAMICGAFIPFFIIRGFYWVIRKIKSFFENYNLRSVMVCPDGELRYCKTKESRYLEGMGEYKFPRHTEEIKEKFPCSLWKANRYAKRFCCDNVGSFRYAPKTVWGNFMPIDKEIIKKAKEIYKRG